MKITIITICFNAEEMIEKTIRSIIPQLDEDDEYILVDGLSTDNTMKVVKKYQKHFSKIISERDNGIADAFNKGISEANGDLIGLINAGDVLHENALVYVKQSYNTRIDVLYGDTIIYDKPNNEKYIRKCKNIEYIQYELPFVHQSCFVSTKAYEKFGKYSDLYKFCMDYEFMLRLYISGAVFQYTPKLISEFTYDGVSYNKPFATLKEDMLIARSYGLKKYKALFYSFKYCFRVTCKRLLTRLKIWSYINKIRKKLILQL